MQQANEPDSNLNRTRYGRQTNREREVMRMLAEAGGEVAIARVAAAVGFTEKGARDLANRLVTRGLVERNYGRVRLTTDGWRHPSVRPARVEQAQAEATLNAGSIEVERQAVELARLRLDQVELERQAAVGRAQVAEAQARRAEAEAAQARAQRILVQEEARMQRARLGPGRRPRLRELPAVEAERYRIVEVQPGQGARQLRALPAAPGLDLFGTPRVADLYPGLLAQRPSPHTDQARRVAANGAAWAQNWQQTAAAQPARPQPPRPAERDLGQEFLAALAGPMAGYHAAHEQAQAAVDEQAWRARRSSHTPRPAPPLYEPEPEDEPAPTVLERLGGGLRRLFRPRREPEPPASMPDTRALELRVRRRP
jgi:hypothetical protein